MNEKSPSFLRRLLDPSMLRFLAVGVVNTLVGSAIMFGLYNLAGCSYWLSSAANYTLTSILSYFLNKRFTFRNRERSAAQVLRFAVNIALCYLIAYGAAKPLALRLLSGAAENVRDNVAMLVGMGLFTVLNYLGQRFFAFAAREGDKKD
jgi:putative flippase GtrA